MAKWLSKEALQIAEKRREAKSKGEKERPIEIKTYQHSDDNVISHIYQQCIINHI